jgi:hypothetical protein
MHPLSNVSLVSANQRSASGSSGCHCQGDGQRHVHQLVAQAGVPLGRWLVVVPWTGLPPPPNSSSSIERCQMPGKPLGAEVPRECRDNPSAQHRDGGRHADDGEETGGRIGRDKQLVGHLGSAIARGASEPPGALNPPGKFKYAGIFQIRKKLLKVLPAGTGIFFGWQDGKKDDFFWENHRCFWGHTPVKRGGQSIFEGIFRF